MKSITRARKLENHIRNLVSEDANGALLYLITNIMERRWWSRVWDLQEIPAAQNAFSNARVAIETRLLYVRPYSPLFEL